MIHDMDRTQIGYGQEMESFGTSGETVFNENEQMNLAAELMEVSNEQEMENFLGDLISKAGNAIGSFVSSPTGQALGGVLKGVAKQILPMAGQALGGYVGGPAGAQIGGQLAQQAAGLFEAESGEQEWESSNTFIKLASEAVKNAAQAPPNANPMAVAKQAVVEAAKIHAPQIAPQILKSLSNGVSEPEGSQHHHAHTGRWIRHGKRIILLGV